jgi:hypothetical protein
VLLRTGWPAAPTGQAVNSGCPPGQGLQTVARRRRELQPIRCHVGSASKEPAGQTVSTAAVPNQCRDVSPLRSERSALGPVAC